MVPVIRYHIVRSGGPARHAGRGVSERPDHHLRSAAGDTGSWIGV